MTRELRFQRIVCVYRHMPVHIVGEKPFYGDTCGLRFRILKMRIMCSLVGQKIIQCDLCGKCFVVNRNVMLRVDI